MIGLHIKSQFCSTSTAYQIFSKSYISISCNSYLNKRRMSSEEEKETVIANLKIILDSIKEATTKTGVPCRLVAVSKTKHSDLIQSCYAVGQRRFGENYVQELEEKSRTLQHLSDIQWHFIGKVQSNKIGKISACPNLSCVETIESIKHCDLFEKELKQNQKTLDVLIQVNTSKEEQKGGASPSAAISLAEHIRNNCPSLRFSGFMTIGSFENSHIVPNPDFEVLREVRKNCCEFLNIDANTMNLSMGMSDDYLTAIQQGSTSVRVGSKIFGPRLYAK